MPTSLIEPSDETDEIVRPGAADQISAALSNEFFEGLLSGAYLGNLTISDVRAGVLDQVRASLGAPPESVARSYVTLQPIVHLESNAIIGYEATVVVGADGHDASQRVGQAAVRSASMEVEAVRAALHRLDDVPRGQFLAVKVSGAGLSHDLLLPTLLDSNVDRLVVEVSAGESADIGAIRHGIDALAHLGVRAAIDGAGKGLFRGASLYEVSPALLKIDRSIIDGCADDDDKRIQIEKLIAVGRRLGALVVATGVDSRDSLATVFLLGVDAAQGSSVASSDTAVAATTEWSDPSAEHGGADFRDAGFARHDTESVFSFTHSV